MGEQEAVVRIYVHTDLVKEFDEWKQALVNIGKYPIAGGTPIVSQVCAEALKRLRTKDCNKVQVHLEKMKGLKRNHVSLFGQDKID
jgi:hypothetical protein